MVAQMPAGCVQWGFCRLWESLSVSRGVAQLARNAVDLGVSRAGPLQADDFYKLLTEYTMAAAEQSAGWLFWNFDNEMGDPRWSFFAAQEAGWFPHNLSNHAYQPRLPDCNAVDGVPIFGDFLLAGAIAAVCGGLIFVGLIGVGIRSACRHRRGLDQ